MARGASTNILGTGIMKLFERRRRFTELQGEYIQKQVFVPEKDYD
jgi:hypothetical protein